MTAPSSPVSFIFLPAKSQLRSHPLKLINCFSFSISLVIRYVGRSISHPLLVLAPTVVHLIHFCARILCCWPTYLLICTPRRCCGLPLFQVKIDCYPAIDRSTERLITWYDDDLWLSRIKIKSLHPWHRKPMVATAAAVLWDQPTCPREKGGQEKELSNCVDFRPHTAVAWSNRSINHWTFDIMCSGFRQQRVYINFDQLTVVPLSLPLRLSPGESFYWHKVPCPSMHAVVVVVNIICWVDDWTTFLH